ncbi:MAG: hypothetical protein QOK02_5943 [Mycobacterium sp.]|jgi:hypothetical protein|nr:hypothetical protein [Mycobacterium sp.]
MHELTQRFLGVLNAFLAERQAVGAIRSATDSGA